VAAAANLTPVSRFLGRVGLSDHEPAEITRSRVAQALPDRRAMRASVLAIGLTACGSGHETVDSRTQIQIPPTITIRGVATARSAQGPTPVSGVTVGAYVYPAVTSATASDTTDATGAFAVSVPTDGMPVDVHLKTSSPSYVDTYYMFPTSFVEDVYGASLDMMTPAAYAQVYASTGVTHRGGSAMLELEATSSVGGPAPGVMFQVQDGTPKYTMNGIVSATASMTDTDGIGFILNAPATTIEVSATGGQYYPPAPVEGFADALTMALVRAGFGGD
jgi:hypothetical protein